MTTPMDVDQAAIQRRRAMAEALQADAVRPIEAPTYQGMQAPVSVTQGLAKMLQAYTARKNLDRADEQEKALMTQQQERRGADVSALISALGGSPAQPAGLQEDASGNVTDTPAMPAQSPAQRLQQVLPMIQDTALQQVGLQQMMAQPKGPIKASAGDVFLDPNTMRPITTIPEAPKEVEQWSEPYMMGGAMVQKNEKTGQIRQAVARPPVTNVNASPNINLGRDDDEYLKARRKAQADGFRELERSAESAYKQIQTLDRFLAASEKGTAGGAQPIISGVQNFLSSFGYSPESLKDVRVMEQAIGDILGNKMAELGARGLTDKDMEILRQALPRVAIDRGSRSAVANILKKSAEFTLGEYDAARAEEERIYPEFAKKTPMQGWFKAYKGSKANKVPQGVEPEVWNVMTPEERALWSR